MAAINEHTRKQIQTGVPSEAYKDGWDRIFGQKVDEECPHEWLFSHYDGNDKMHFVCALCRGKWSA